MLLIGNGMIITHDKENKYIEDGCVVIDGNKIIDIGKSSELKSKYSNYNFINAEGKLIMPGFINTHHHIYSAFARGLNLQGPKSKSFTDILKNVWWRIDKKLINEDILYSGYVTLIEGIKNGVTTVFDHHASPFAVEGSLFTLSRVASDLGVRSSFCYEVSDRDGVDILKLGIRENIDFIKYADKNMEDMQKGIFGMHASFTLSHQSLLSCAEAMEGIDSGYHIHVAEGIEDLINSLNTCNKRVVERLNDYKILGEKSLAIHAININEDEMEIFKSNKTSVVNNPESNMGNAVGATPIMKMFNKGVLVGLGTDGFSSDMLQSLKVANLINKHELKDSNVGFNEACEMLFTNNSKITTNYFNNEVGVIKKGAYADIIILEYSPFTEINGNNFLGHILFGMNSRMVETVIIDGKIVMKNRKLINVDEELIYRKAREASINLWRRLGV